jgi:hypothetical protein
MTEEKIKKTRKKKDFRYATSFTMRFDNFTLDMLEQVAYDEDKTRPEVIRSAMKFLYLKKYGQKELDILRQKHRYDLAGKK